MDKLWKLNMEPIFDELIVLNGAFIKKSRMTIFEKQCLR